MSFHNVSNSSSVDLFSKIEDRMMKESILLVAKQTSSTPNQVTAVLFFAIVAKMRDVKASTPLTSERVSYDAELERLADDLMSESKGMQSVGKVSSVAALVHPPSDSDLERLADEMLAEVRGGVLYDPRLSIADFSRLNESSALDAIHFLTMMGRKMPKEQLLGVYQFFNGVEGRFSKFLGLGDKNKLFDSFLNAVQSDLQDPSPDLNEHEQLKREVFKFAFSDERFEYVLIRDEEISSALRGEMLQYESRTKSEELFTRIESLKERGDGKYRKWVELNTSGSSSLKEKEAFARWSLADARKTRYAKARNFEIGYIKLIHRDLTKGEQGVANAGSFRETIVRISGGGATAVPPTPNRVEDLMSGYENWLVGERAKCERGEKSVILTAAQAYQRLVTIHPFENGNGRISRLVMNFVLESFDLPPAVLGKDVLDAVFCLKTKHSQQDGEAFVKKVFQGVQSSAELIYGNQ